MTQPILHEDSQWLVLEKPTDLASHAPASGRGGLHEWLNLHLQHHFHLCSRLDKGTSGVMLLAKTGQAAAQAQQIHDNLQAHKRYIFLSHQRHALEQWHQEQALDGKPCHSQFRLLDSANGLHCYEAVIQRGRTHQIRRHAGLAGVPILGDKQYGGQDFPRLCLHCRELSWPGIAASLHSPIPDSFRLAMQGAKGLQLSAALAWERRLAWPLLISNCMRLVQRGELPLEVSIDIYHHTLLVSSFSEPGDEILARLQPVIDYLAGKVDIAGGLLRHHNRNPHQTKLSQKVESWGSPQRRPRAHEHGHYFSLDLDDRCHAGLFLDQRDSRQRLAQLARGKRLANLFAFTCSLSVVAAAAQAEVVFSVDLAGSSLERGKENFALNQLEKSGIGKFIKEDVRKWLARQLRKQQRDPATFAYWDIIICDPPVFASAGGGKGFHVEKQWPELARQIRQILAHDGIALFANNHRAGNDRYYQAVLEQHFSKVTINQPPLDFPQLTNMPPHVRIYWCEA